MSGPAQHWVAVAHILRPRGNKGEVAAELLTDFPQRLTELREAFLGDGAETCGPRRIEIKACWLSQNHPGQAVFHFDGCSSINDAEKLRGIVMRETSTLGVRSRSEHRHVLLRCYENVLTKWGEVRIKIGSMKGHEMNAAPEYEDCHRIAVSQNVPLKSVMQEALRLYLEKKNG